MCFYYCVMQWYPLNAKVLKQILIYFTKVHQFIWIHIFRSILSFAWFLRLCEIWSINISLNFWYFFILFFKCRKFVGEKEWEVWLGRSNSSWETGWVPDEFLLIFYSNALMKILIAIFHKSLNFLFFKYTIIIYIPSVNYYLKTCK